MREAVPGGRRTRGTGRRDGAPAAGPVDAGRRDRAVAGGGPAGRRRRRCCPALTRLRAEVGRRPRRPGLGHRAAARSGRGRRSAPTPTGCSSPRDTLEQAGPPRARRPPGRPPAGRRGGRRSPTWAARRAPTRSRWPGRARGWSPSTAIRSPASSPPPTPPRWAWPAGCEVVDADVVDLVAGAGDGRWPGATPRSLDPARRAGGRRQLDPDRWSPPWSTVTALLDRVPASVVKVAPGLDHDRVPDGHRGGVGLRRRLDRRGAALGPRASHDLAAGDAGRAATRRTS